MPSNTVRKTLIIAFEIVTTATAACLCLPCVCFLICSAERHKPPPELSDPPPLPNKERVAIQPSRAPQPLGNCYFIHRLPIELRQAIYELALGPARGHIELYLADDRPNKCRVIRYRDAGPCDSKLLALQCRAADLHSLPRPAERHRPEFAVGLLRTCRQVYLEAQPVLLQRNTFHIAANDVPVILPAALGQHALAQLRSLSLHYNHVNKYHPADLNSSLLYPYFDWESPTYPPLPTLLSSMHNLTRLEFCYDVASVHPPPSLAMDSPEIQFDVEKVLNGTWARGVHALRDTSPHLREFDMVFAHFGEPVADPEWPLCWRELRRRMRELMLGSGADI